VSDNEPLPPLESDDPAWVAMRRREWASGSRPEGQAKKRGLASSALAKVEPHRAVVDVLCRGRHVARVLVPDPDVRLPDGVVLQVACEARVTKGGGIAYWPLDGYLGDTVAVAVCRCGTSHRLAVNRLIAEGRGRTPGAPKRVDLPRVVAEGDT
jgi:hypothetical protein